MLNIFPAEFITDTTHANGKRGQFYSFYTYTSDVLSYQKHVKTVSTKFNICKPPLATWTKSNCFLSDYISVIVIAVEELLSVALVY